MARSLSVRSACIAQILSAMRQQGYFNQLALAIDVGITQSTVSQFCRGKYVDRDNFQAICGKLALNWQDICESEESQVIPAAPSGLPPTPAPSYEYPTGIVRIDSPYYILRSPQEEQCYAEILHPGALIRIKAPRQFGKSSLMWRILNHAQQQGQQTLYLSFQQVEQPCLADFRQFLGWFCGVVVDELGLSDLHQKYAELAPKVGSTTACLMFFQKYLLPALNQPLTLGLDEIDRILDAPLVSKEFFALLRVMNEKSKLGGIWEKFRLILVHATPAIEAFVPLDLNQSPFNVGLPITLDEFTAAQIHTIAQRYGLDSEAETVQQVIAWVGGSPFLVRLMLHEAVQQQISLQSLVANPDHRLTLYREPLQRLHQTLQRQPELWQLMQKVARSPHPVAAAPLLGYQLHSTGLVTLAGDRMAPRCQLYRQYFASLPQ
jgi:DNA-binding Xre family transcriptional regulator